MRTLLLSGSCGPGLHTAAFVCLSRRNLFRDDDVGRLIETWSLVSNDSPEQSFAYGILCRLPIELLRRWSIHIALTLAEASSGCEEIIVRLLELPPREAAVVLGTALDRLPGEAHQQRAGILGVLTAHPPAAQLIRQILVEERGKLPPSFRTSISLQKIQTRYSDRALEKDIRSGAAAYRFNKPQLSDQGSKLVAAVCANPDDDLPRLVFADWLDEHGDSERAEFIRLQIERAQSGSTTVNREADLFFANRYRWLPVYRDYDCSDALERGFVREIGFADSREFRLWSTDPDPTMGTVSAIEINSDDWPRISKEMCQFAHGNPKAGHITELAVGIRHGARASASARRDFARALVAGPMLNKLEQIWLLTPNQFLDGNVAAELSNLDRPTFSRLHFGDGVRPILMEQLMDGPIADRIREAAFYGAISELGPLAFLNSDRCRVTSLHLHYYPVAFLARLVQSSGFASVSKLSVSQFERDPMTASTELDRFLESDRLTGLAELELPANVALNNDTVQRMLRSPNLVALSRLSANVSKVSPQTKDELATRLTLTELG